MDKSERSVKNICLKINDTETRAEKNLLSVAVKFLAEFRLSLSRGCGQYSFMQKRTQKEVKNTNILLKSLS